MVGTRCIAVLAFLLSTGLPAALGAQRAMPAAVTASAATRSMSLAVPADIHGPFAVRLPDTAQSQRRHPMAPFLVGGAIVGGVLGGMLAASYDPCGEPQPGVTCMSTSPTTGVLLGVGLGLAAGWVLWAITAPAQPAPTASGG